MTEQQITDEILRYIKDKSYNYAVLIDSDWGSGKTYFATHGLSEQIEQQEKKSDTPRSINYITLYGCKNVEDIQERIAWNFVDKAKTKISDKKGWEKKGKTIAGNVVNTSRKIGNYLLKKYIPETSVYDIAVEWLDLAAYIFIVDDLERCECSINEIFGFFNELVEHENTKVIFLANEKEITGIAESDNVALQYQLSLNEQVDWPEPDGLVSYKWNSDKVSTEEMERRRKILFPQKEANEKYRTIREKLIGEILKYEPNIKEIMKQIIDKAPCLDVDKEILLEEISFYCITMSNYNHLNLRTYQFFLSKIIFLFDMISIITDVEPSLVKSIKKSLIEETFRDAVVFKSNYKPVRTGLEWLENDESENISVIGEVIKQFVENGCFSLDDFKKSIMALQANIKIAILDDDPYNLLRHEFYKHSQSWCEEELEILLERLANDKYPITMYLDIICIIQRLISIGFDNTYIDEAKKSMIDNITSMNEINTISVDYLVADNEDSWKKIKNHIDDINKAIIDHSEIVRGMTIQEIIKKDNWVYELEKYVYSDNNRYVQDKPLFSKAPSADWINAIEISSPEIIDKFRDLLIKIYPRDRIRKAYQEDADSIKEILAFLSKYADEDLIKKMQIGWVKDLFEEIVKRHEPALICVSKDDDQKESVS